MKKQIILSWFAIASSLFAQSSRPEKPNIIVLLVDDLGWQDTQCYDVDYPTFSVTPNIDALAAKGVKFSQAYSPAPTCSPSRAAIVSGMHPARSHNTHINGGTLPQVDSNNSSVLITPWYSGRMTVDQPSIADALKAGGYATGMTGKWHNSANLYSYPQPTDVGFDVSTHNEEYMFEKYGSHVKGIQEEIVHPDLDGDGESDDLDYRPTNYSTSDSQYPLDDNGYPVDPVQVETLEFIENNKSEPFFLYNATWLVHAPIQCRSEGIVMKYYNDYVADMDALNETLAANGEELEPIEPLLDYRWSVRGSNPYYLGMVETLDYYIGQTMDYLESTDDPRWAGHKLIENTYIVFTSDNGGVTSARAEQITDNTPLQKGKKYTNEGGIRVPFIITGPNIPEGVDSNVMINGLDIYPTALSWAGLEKNEGTILDGSDLAPLLVGDYTDNDLVLESDGTKRTMMFWHFPHSTQSSTVVRDSKYKLIKNYGHEYISKLSEFELYKLSDISGDRVDIEESESLDIQFRLDRMSKIMESYMEEMDATKPYFNSESTAINDGKNDLIPVVTDTSIIAGPNKTTAVADFKENGAEVVKSFLIYKLEDEEGAEWFRDELSVNHYRSKVKAFVPLEATAAVITLVDENNFLTSVSLEL